MMDMKRMRRPQQASPTADPENDGALRAAFEATEKKPPPRLVRMRPATVLVILFSLCLVLAALSGANRSFPLQRFRPAWPGILEAALGGSANGTPPSFSARKDKLLHGLLAAEFDEKSCLSRYHSILYRKESPHLPSSYLLEKLRKYESLHKKCAPNTELYKKAVEQLKSGRGSQSTECNYVVWISYSGLGNRMLSIASTFLYALLTNRVLLIDSGSDMADLFCEPFPESSWILPSDFPVNEFTKFDIKTRTSYGNMVKDKAISNHVDSGSTQSPPAYIYLHLSHDYDDYDKLFFCEDDQKVLQNVPWLLLRSNNYFIPSLFLIPTYDVELRNLFPVKDTVFHHLGRYLFHPTNSVWGLISRYYQSYLAKADERVGMQVRVFEEGAGPFQYVLDQILACSLKEKLLPDLNSQEAVVLTPNARSIALLLTSLESGYYEKIRNMYWEHPTATGEIISVHQPSYEGFQQTEKQTHNMKALAEIYLLSLTDMLVTSAWSTFGYVAQGLGGLQPWILLKPENQTTPDPPCRRAMSIEPCFHAPPLFDCKAKVGADTGALVPHVRHCEDMSWGLKLVNLEEW
ncbi:galactoside 2-alpha-L-fucosyltransferase-like [Canna indica]|uniref:Fucosyltransferase n=1 Tax=Canna indica TaxID=4628 RepID=A0AAQ3QP33_9LILI|nr:galactoside 2-alpha-L-fucosyltransferase-like [Canna indica]